MSRSVGVVFELLQVATRPGEALQVVGSSTELGEWRPLTEDGEEEARALRTCPVTYPRWISRVPVWFQLAPEQGGELNVEYKFVKDWRGLDGDCSGVKWEARIDNRCLSLPAEDGSLWLVSHARWNCRGEPVQVTRISVGNLSSHRSPSVMDMSIASAKPETVPSVPSEPPLEQQVPPLLLRTEEHFALTPHPTSPRSVTSFAWPIEVEFSASFTSPRVSFTPREEPRAGGKAADSPRDPLQDAKPPPDARILELWLENTRLRTALAEAREQIRPLLRENAALRARLGEDVIVDAEKQCEKELQEPQEEPEAIGDLP
mmetsp:Transcript_92665/g.276355  ORF Transcript_92665/g.276355 Transcript_92665/m.276355 type:complete len:317 (+) Transcript_92665:61-1011(+)